MRNIDPERSAAFHTAYPCPPHRGGTTQRAILTGRIVHVPDIRADPEYTYQDVAKAADFRSVLSVPMLREGKPIGTITVYRVAAKAFPDSQIELLKTFAEQAVIAIENVRLFKELEVRNRDHGGAGAANGDQRDTRVISGSPTDTQPVFDTIAGAAPAVRRDFGQRLHFRRRAGQLAAFKGVSAAGAEAVRRTYRDR
jgi:GAF domain-containing protein